jgi:hypothetical protein
MDDANTPTRNLAERVKEATADEELQVIDALFLLGCRRSEKHLPVIQAFDWSRFPQSLEFGLQEARDQNCDQIREAGRAFLSAAIEGLRNNNGRSGSDLEVLRAMQLRLEGVPAQQLGEHLESDPVRRRDPKTYRNWIVAYGYSQIREWACGASPNHEGAAVPSRVPPSDVARTGNQVASWMRWTAAALVLVIMAALLFVANHRHDQSVSGTVLAASTSRPYMIPITHLGLHLENGHGSPFLPHLDDTLDLTVLPNLGSQIEVAVLIPRNESLRAWPDSHAPLDSVRVALGTDRSGAKPGTVVLWDPATDAIEWEYQFVQRPGDADMNPDLPPDAGSEAYRVRWVAHSSPYGSLGQRLVAIFEQKFSPTFVVMLDLRTGRELSRYASYGYLSEPLILDIDQNGDVEIVLGGTDNACDAATLTVLDPEMEDGATSSVGWNAEGEGALWRALMPDPRALLDGYFASHAFPTWQGRVPPRLHTYRLDVRAWDQRTGRLAVAVAYSPHTEAYEVTLVRGRPDFSVPVIRLGDSAEQVWHSLGLDPVADPPRLSERIVVIEQGEGFECPEGMNPDTALEN